MLSNPDSPKRNMNKFLASVIGGAMGAVAFTGCAAPADKPAEAPKTAQLPPKQEVTPAPTPTPEQTPSTFEPFDRDLVAELTEATVSQFEKYKESDRMQYLLSIMFDEKYTLSMYGGATNQVTQNGDKLYKYNPFTSPLSAESKGQAILNSYLYRQALLMALPSTDDQLKAISGLVRDPESKKYKDFEKFVEVLNGPKELAEATLEDPTYTVREEENYTIPNAAGKDELYKKIITDKSEFTFVFLPVEDFSKANNKQNKQSDDSEIQGLWLVVADKELPEND